VGLHARRQCFRPEAENGGRDARAPQFNCMVTLSADGHKYDDVCCAVFGLGLGARRAHPHSGAATDEQRRPRPKTTQPSGRRSFLAQASLLAPHRPTRRACARAQRAKGMHVAPASSEPKILAANAHAIREQDTRRVKTPVRSERKL
jgi:hypothetical protein